MTITERNAKIHPELKNQKDNKALNDWAADTIRTKTQEEKDSLLPNDQSYKPFLEK